MILLLDLVTQFSKDTGMKFGESKCAYLQLERGGIKVNSENIKINNLSIQQVKEGESYKCLGIDENISFDGTTNKETVLTTNILKGFVKSGPVSCLGTINSYLIMHLQFLY